MEQWKPVKGYPKYLVSNLGNVRTMGIRPRILKPDKIDRVTLTNTEGKSTFSRSRLLRENWKYEFIKYLDDEECKEIRNSPGYYITNKGRVFSLETYSFQTPCLTNKNSYYYSVRYGPRNKTPKTPLHTLVGRHFLPEYKEGLWILHKDEELPFPEINWVDNLFVGTPTDNNKDTIQKGRGNRPLGHNRNPWGRRGKPTDT